LFYEFAPCIRESAILHTGWTGRLTGSAGQAAVKVDASSIASLTTFEHVPDQVNATTWPVSLVKPILIRRACGVAKSAVHTFLHEVRSLSRRFIFAES
jgi:hypothetical protein